MKEYAFFSNTKVPWTKTDNKVGFKSSVNKFQIITTCSDYNGIKSEKTKRHKYSNLEI